MGLILLVSNYCGKFWWYFKVSLKGNMPCLGTSSLNLARWMNFQNIVSVVLLASIAYFPLCYHLAGLDSLTSMSGFLSEKLWSFGYYLVSFAIVQVAFSCLSLGYVYLLRYFCLKKPGLNLFYSSMQHF